MNQEILNNITPLVKLELSRIQHLKQRQQVRTSLGEAATGSGTGTSKASD